MFTPPEDVDQEVLRKTALIDKKSKRMLVAILRDEHGDNIEIDEVGSKLISFVLDHVELGGDNATLTQVMPLMGQIMTVGIFKIFDKHTATLLLSQEPVRTSLIYMMAVSFYLLKFMQKKGLKLYTSSEDITDEQIEQYERIIATGDALHTAAALGHDPEKLLEHLIEKGMIRPEDIAEYRKRMGKDDPDNKN